MTQANKNIFFSIIICCYNSEKNIEETINSIISQSYNFWEIIIINDASSDNTENIIREFMKSDFKITYHSNKNNQGFAKSRNIGVNLANYDWITIIDHDDIMTKDRLMLQSKIIKENENIQLFFGDSEIFENKKVLSTRSKNFFSHYNRPLNQLLFNKEKLTSNLIRYGCFIVSSTVTFNKTCFKKVNGFNEKLKFTSDYDFFFRLSKNFDFFYIDKIINRWRSHSDQSTVKNRKVHDRELSYFLIKNIFDSKISYSIKLYAIVKALYYFFKF
ncbi:MAG: UDP-Glc:alpha-D-GlcNAc-diphosphoundecaprenol beta-1,3-glucosyltransferase WfgD [Alphaproteobacteria bacterium MarineAlpha5_Bin6]|nr:MAG: UDP-Glc:alpha-D-GlcNAc-diphosphoundecaprenol beta-1,3-glucosyltransferase WfgD [Alphaproteobacteria bacterium MarineAlpha5_Bin6]|tara:strand:- start:1060 stop:1878 length:819 start_codon:yes stop_codon:yes gene_type:complete